MKSIKEWMSEEQEPVVEAGKKLLNSPDEIDESNPLVKKLVKSWITARNVPNVFFKNQADGSTFPL